MTVAEKPATLAFNPEIFQLEFSAVHGFTQSRTRFYEELWPMAWGHFQGQRRTRGAWMPEPGDEEGELRLYKLFAVWLLASAGKHITQALYDMIAEGML